MGKSSTSELMYDVEDVDELFESFESRILSKVKSMVETERRILEFELAFSSLISEEKIKETDKSVREVRDENWSKALKKAKGDYEKAVSIFSSCNY